MTWRESRECPTCGAGLHLNFEEMQWAYCMYCSTCRKVLTKEYGSDTAALLAWHHGPDSLPPNCPFCKFPPKVTHISSKDPKVTCTFTLVQICPLAGVTMTLEDWNKCRPQLTFLEILAERWEKKPGFAKPLRALKSAIKQQVRNRYCGDY